MCVCPGPGVIKGSDIFVDQSFPEGEFVWACSLDRVCEAKIRHILSDIYSWWNKTNLPWYMWCHNLFLCFNMTTVRMGVWAAAGGREATWSLLHLIQRRLTRPSAPATEMILIHFSNKFHQVDLYVMMANCCLGFSVYALTLSTPFIFVGQKSHIKNMQQISFRPCSDIEYVTLLASSVC